MSEVDHLPEERKSLVTEALEIEEEKDRRLRKLDKFAGDMQFIVDFGHDLIWRMNKEYYEKYYPTPPHVEITKQEVLQDPAIKYLLEPGHVLPEGIKKHSKLFKNVAVLLCNAGFTKYEMQDISRKIVANSPGHKAGEIMGWVKHIQSSGKKWEFNRNEFNEVMEAARKHG